MFVLPHTPTVHAAGRLIHSQSLELLLLKRSMYAFPTSSSNNKGSANVCDSRAAQKHRFIQRIHKQQIHKYYQILLLVASLLLVVRPGAPSSVLVPCLGPVVLGQNRNGVSCFSSDDILFNCVSAHTSFKRYHACSLATWFLWLHAVS